MYKSIQSIIKLDLISLFVNFQLVKIERKTIFTLIRFVL